MLDPNTIHKYLYIEKTPTWKVRVLYSFGIISWLLVLWGFSGAVLYDPFYRYFVGPILAVLTVYQLSSFALNLFYRQFDLSGHLLWVQAFWIIRGGRQPSVDIFLPICGEDIAILRNTWEHVSRLRYRKKHMYVLDDSKEDCAAHKQLAEQYGFTYLERPNKGEMKKAGNLKYGFERSKGEFIAIFDADFAPHPDFLHETLPYMTDRKVGIVQTPQYFETNKNVRAQFPLAYNAAVAEEPFYRFIQVTRNRFGGAICCGSNALYRRSALQQIGGPVQMEYSEDAHTGFAVTRAGYQVRFMPVLLALGLCPDNPHSFFHQQHRWCMGSMRLMLSKNFWLASVSWKIKFCFITGFLFYLHHPFVILLSFQLFWTLFVYNDYIPLSHSTLFYPHFVFAFIYLFVFPIAEVRIGYFNVLIARTYAYTHAIKTALFKRSVRWVSTNARHINVSPAFKHTMWAVGLYVSVYSFLILFAAFLGYLHPLDINYYSVQFWLFYNMALSTFLFWQMYKFYNARKRSSMDKD